MRRIEQSTAGSRCQDFSHHNVSTTETGCNCLKPRMAPSRHPGRLHVIMQTSSVSTVCLKGSMTQKVKPCSRQSCNFFWQRASTLECLSTREEYETISIWVWTKRHKVLGEKCLHSYNFSSSWVLFWCVAKHQSTLGSACIPKQFCKNILCYEQ